MTTTPAARRTPRLLTGAAAALCLASLTACDFDVLPMLDITADASAVAPGADVTGSVEDPFDDITVTLSARATPGVVARRCDYDSGDETFACPTHDLAEGVYVVQVTDTGQPDVGDTTTAVAISAIEGYDPTVDYEKSGYDTGEPVQLRLTGWGADREVLVAVRSSTGEALFGERVTVDGSGEATVDVGVLPPGGYELQLDDDLWSIGNGFDLGAPGAGFFVGDDRPEVG